MSPAKYRKTLTRFRTRMAADAQIDDVTYDAFVWWMNQQLAEMDQEKKKAAVEGQLGLRVRLKNLVVAILTHNSAAVKEAKHASH
ncbi:hypothetical protein LOZ80_37945 [Paenibacillus sp. HWE-109]|uniref:hypothetical protein n=1 Tax=Paenibacillus sp. HWE-109 TaxID=1306526 RepID=UPI001EDD7647|nr:hypothetical protein [Paenibacillus sp. HWE-109]UKS27175.1 hypothetical protein LOZ80_37945 [Paenibacillus sp. HWE-109]